MDDADLVPAVTVHAKPATQHDASRVSGEHRPDQHSPRRLGDEYRCQHGDEQPARHPDDRHQCHGDDRASDQRGGYRPGWAETQGMPMREVGVVGIPIGVRHVIPTVDKGCGLLTVV
ncbi:MAG: hypothetical protein ACJ735_05945 [Actinomycetes bacterium]